MKPVDDRKDVETVEGERTVDDLGSRRSRLHAALADAARIIAPQWPLSTWVAVNPLVGLVHRGFHEAVAEAARWQPMDGYPGQQLLRRALAEGLVDPEDVRVSAAALGEPELASLLLDEDVVVRATGLEQPALGEADEQVAGLLPTPGPRRWCCEPVRPLAGHGGPRAPASTRTRRRPARRPPRTCRRRRARRPRGTRGRHR